MPNYLAQLELSDGSKIVLPLKCREYHAQKLSYVLSRTLDREVFRDAHFLAIDGSPCSSDLESINVVMNISADVPADLKLLCREVGK